MAGTPTDKQRARKEKVRKRTGSAMRKAVQTGRDCDIFIAVVYWNPTYGRLDGDTYLPAGCNIPDVNAFLQKLVKDGRPKRVTRTRKKRCQAEQREVSDEIVVKSVQRSPSKDEPTEQEPRASTLQSEVTDHGSPKGLRIDDSITQTTNTNSNKQATMDEQLLGDLDIDPPRTAIPQLPAGSILAGADTGKKDGAISVVADDDLITMLAGGGPDWRAITRVPTWAESGTLAGGEAAGSVNRSRSVVMVRFMQELRDVLARRGSK